MNKKKIWLLLSLVALLIAGSWLTKDRKIEKVEEVEQVEKVGEAKLVLNFGEGKISSYSAKIDEGSTVLEILSQVAQENDLSLETKESDFGTFVEEIGGVKNTSDHFWMYYVNDQLAEVGAGQYELKPGDVVEWRYEKFE